MEHDALTPPSVLGCSTPPGYPGQEKQTPSEQLNAKKVYNLPKYSFWFLWLLTLLQGHFYSISTKQ